MRDDVISRQVALDALYMPDYENGEAYSQYVNDKRAIELVPSAQPTYTDEEIKKMQDLESAEIEKAYQLGYEDGKKDAQPERKKGRWINKPHIYGVAYCSECDFELHINDTPYCPNCGYRMEGDDSEID